MVILFHLISFGSPYFAGRFQSWPLDSASFSFCICPHTLVHSNPHVILCQHVNSIASVQRQYSLSHSVSFYVVT